MRMFKIFRVKREEWLVALVMLLLLVGVNVLAVSQNQYGLFTKAGRLGFWSIFWDHYCVSGFDSFTYIILSKWRPLYSPYRHPLLALMMWPLSQLNGWLMSETGTNCAVFIVAVCLVVLMFYSFLFAYRIFREVVGLRRIDATLLSLLLYSFAYVLVTAIVPDHFAISMFLLLLTLYVAGKDLQARRSMGGWKVAIYYFLASGVTLTNGVKVFLAQWFVNGRKTWHRRNILLTYVVPTVLLLGCYLYQQQGVVAEDVQKSQRILEKKMQTDSAFVVKMEQHKKHMSELTLVSDNPFMRSTYKDIPVGRTVVENLLGETLQLHDQYLLKDVNRNRPVFVSYSTPVPYIVEAIIVLLFLCGIWAGRRSRFLWLCLSWFVFDMLLHLGLGFGMIEPYIMAGHWVFVIPIAVAYLFKSTDSTFFRKLGRTPIRALRTLVGLLTLYLYIYNVTLLVQFFVH